MKGVWINALIAVIALAKGLAGELRVAAASSLSEAVTDLCTAYQKKQGSKVTPVFAGSNVLARQIEYGAPIDIFISADQVTMAKLVKAKLVRSVQPLLTNSLVVVVPSDSQQTFNSSSDLLSLKRIAIGDPTAVPAGVYAKTWLSEIGLWKNIEPKCVGAENVRSALAVVESGNVDAAIVYRTDAAVSEKSKIAWTVPDTESPVIIYPIAISTHSRDIAETARFIKFLRSKEGAEIFTARGFGIANE